MKRIITSSMGVFACLMSICAALSAQSPIVINEVSFAPSPDIPANALVDMLGNTEDDREWIELYHRDECGDPIDIGCMIIASIIEDDNVYATNFGAFVLPANTILQPGEHITIGGNNSDADFNLSEYVYKLGNDSAQFHVRVTITTDPTGYHRRWYLTDNLGWIGLFDKDGTPLDAVFWNHTLMGEFRDLDTSMLDSIDALQVEFPDIYIPEDCGGDSLSGLKNLLTLYKEGVATYTPGFDEYYTDGVIERRFDGSNEWGISANATQGTSNSSSIIPAEFEVDFESNSAKVNVDEIVRFTDLSTDAVVDRYWVFEGGEPATSQERNPEVIYREAGTYSVKLVASTESCTDSIVKDEFITVELVDGFSYSDRLGSTGISCFQATNRAIYLSSNESLGDVEIHIKDMTGAVVFVENKLIEANQEIYLNVPTLAKGNYLLQINGFERVYTKKINIK